MRRAAAYSTALSGLFTAATATHSYGWYRNGTVLPNGVNNPSAVTEQPHIDYSLQATFDAGNFMNSFTVQNIADPTSGFVQYVDQSTAESNGYYYTSNNQVYIGVDNKNIISSNSAGRNSVRVQSNDAWTHALIIADFAHIPGSDCGSWPAFWTVGPNWPNDGEIDIIEGVNKPVTDQMTLHTASGCSVNVGSGGQLGNSGATDCGANGGYDGCDVVSQDGQTIGTPFNNAGGGVYATQWTSSGIMIWYFEANQVPSDITNGNPNPSGWGTPQANFAGCDFDQYFQDHSIIINTDFCGSWAGAVWSTGSCASAASTCQDYVAANPGAFDDAYWLINSIKVYQ